MSSNYPSVMQTELWQRRLLHAQLASWAQLRHDSILYAKPSGYPGECDFPDGWVDPYWRGNGDGDAFQHAWSDS